MENGFLSFVQQGGFAVYPLLLCSILGVAIVFERGFYLLKATQAIKGSYPELHRLIEKGDLKRAHQIAQTTFLGKIYQRGLSLQAASHERILRNLDHVRIEETQFLRNRVWILGTIGSLAPFIGLFGTVIGIMRAFGEIARTQEGGFTTVSAGISEALIATAAGIFVGVLSVAAYNFFSNQINQVAFQLKVNAEQLADSLSQDSVLASKE